MVNTQLDYFNDIDGGISHLNFKFMSEEITSGDYTILTITDQYKYRPDLLARDYLGDEKLYWILLMFNKITSLEQLDSGKNINIPTSSFIRLNYDLLKKEVL